MDSGARAKVHAYGVNIPPVGKLRYSETAALFGEPLIIGSPEDAIRMIESHQNRARFTHLVMAMALPGVDHRKVMRSMELFARAAMPHFGREKARN